MSSSKQQTPQYSVATKVFYIVFYGVASSLIIYANKILFKVYNFHFHNTLLLGQSLLSIFLILVFRKLKIIDFEAGSTETAKRVFPLTFFCTADILLGMWALSLVNIPMFTVLRRLSLVSVMVLEYFFLNQVAPPAVVRSVGIAVIGAICAGVGDLSFDLVGYIMAFLANVTTGCYRVLVKKLQLKQLNEFALMYYNSVLGLPFVLGLAMYSGELDRLPSYEFLYDISFQLCFFMSAAVAFMLNYSMFKCTMVNSALTTSITGQTKNVLTALLGFFAFGDVQYHPLNVLGHVIGMVGGYLYFRATLSANKDKPQPIIPLADLSDNADKSQTAPTGELELHLDGAQQEEVPEIDLDEDTDDSIDFEGSPALNGQNGAVNGAIRAAVRRSSGGSGQGSGTLKISTPTSTQRTELES